jgi:hypothetical protein
MFIDLHILTHFCIFASLHPWHEINLILVYDIFNVLLGLVHKYFIENFCIYVHQGNWSVVFMCVCVLILFW